MVTNLRRHQHIPQVHGDDIEHVLYIFSMLNAANGRRSSTPLHFSSTRLPITTAISLFLINMCNALAWQAEGAPGGGGCCFTMTTLFNSRQTSLHRSSRNTCLSKVTAKLSLSNLLAPHALQAWSSRRGRALLSACTRTQQRWQGCFSSRVKKNARRIRQAGTTPSLTRISGML